MLRYGTAARAYTCCVVKTAYDITVAQGYHKDTVTICRIDANRVRGIVRKCDFHFVIIHVSRIVLIFCFVYRQFIEQLSCHYRGNFAFCPGCAITLV